MAERVVIGIVRQTRGLHGELVVESRTDLPDRFEQLEELYLVTSSGERRVTIESVRRPKDPEIWIQFREVTDREGGKSLRGATLEIDLEDRPEPPEGTYYYDQLVGLDVFDVSGMQIGTLTSVFPRGGQDVYGVKTPDGEVLIPATDAIVKSVDLKAGRMIIDPPDGLLEDEHAN
jgi:16S rRNA processing protein RimM